jgi:5,10-methenyltetrahydromethanopterin hydrogenase
MILGFVAIGIALGYWTIKHSISMPVHESNEFMMKYQKADLNANEIIEAQNRFDKRYNLEILNFRVSDFKPEHLKRKVGKILALEHKNTIEYKLTTKDGKAVNDANVSLLVTRPHTEKEDQLFKNLKAKNGIYKVENIQLKNPGRYILRVRVQKGDAIGFKDTEAYLKP